MLALGIGAAASGTALYMNYAYRKDVSDAQVKSLPESVKRWKGQLDATGSSAQKRIQDELEPLLKQAAIGETLDRILLNAQPAIWSVRTYDATGAASVGTAFVVASDSEKTFLVTSFDVVSTSTVKPGPEIVIRKGNEEIAATLWTWQEEKDLALLIVNKGGLPRLDWAPASDTRVGTQVFALSGFGTAGGAITNGFVADVSESGVQHSAAVGTHFRGGPLLNEKGLVIAVLSRTYAPFGFASEGVWFAPPVAGSCDKLLKCPNGVVSGAGTQR
jgi:S1-C subfamily serine protease